MCYFSYFRLVVRASLELPVQTFPARTENEADDTFSDETPTELLLPELSKFTVTIIDKQNTRTDKPLFLTDFHSTSKRTGNQNSRLDRAHVLFETFVTKQRMVDSWARQIVADKMKSQKSKPVVVNGEVIVSEDDQTRTELKQESSGRQENLHIIARFLNLVETHLSTVAPDNLERDLQMSDLPTFGKEVIDRSTESTDVSTEFPQTFKAAKRVFIFPTEPKKVKTPKQTPSKSRSDSSEKILQRALWYFIRQPMFFRSPMVTRMTGRHPIAKRNWYLKRYMYFDDLASDLVG